MCIRDRDAAVLLGAGREGAGATHPIGTAFVGWPEQGDAELAVQLLVHRVHRLLGALARGDSTQHAPALRIETDLLVLFGGDADRFALVVEGARVPVAVPVSYTHLR